MKDFGEFNIEPATKGFKGDKININKLINVNIIVERFNVVPSKFEGKSDRLDLQVIYNNDYRLVMGSFAGLIEMIKRVPESGFPFKCRIVKEESGRFVFTKALEQ